MTTTDRPQESGTTFVGVNCIFLLSNIATPRALVSKSEWKTWLNQALRSLSWSDVEENDISFKVF